MKLTAFFFPLMTDRPLRVGLFGLGTVGTGAARIITGQCARLSQRAGRAIELAKVVVRNPSKPRDIALPRGLITDDHAAILQDSEIDLGIELIGGISPAFEIVRDLLRSGKDVVTANKALLSQRGPELYAIAKENGRCIAFEASVAGGIPVIATVGQSLAANQILSVEAILNGTSNFILHNMQSKGVAYSAALKEAQEAGFAEADPTMDVDGTDAAQKLIILAQLGFGTRVEMGHFPRVGIDHLELADLEFADELGYVIKLLAIARLTTQGQLEMSVEPSLVGKHRMLARVDGPYNMVALEGDAVGRTWLSGPGAGRMPTASAVVADVIDVAAGRAAITFPRLDLWRETSRYDVQPEADRERRYYLRLNIEDRPHVIADIADILGREKISIASVIQHEVAESTADEDGPPSVPLVIMTHKTTAGRLNSADAEIARLTTVRRPRIRMPVAD